MGLDVQAKGMQDYSIGYGRYYQMRRKIILQAYDERCLSIFDSDSNSEDDIAYWNSVCNDDLDLFLLHSDCDGKFTPKECRKILKALKHIHIDMEGYGYANIGEHEPNMLDQWRKMFKYCADRRVNMYYY